MRSANALMTARNDRAVAVQIAHGGATKPQQIIKPAPIFNGPVIAHGKFLRPPASILHDDDRTIVFDGLVPMAMYPISLSQRGNPSVRVSMSRHWGSASWWCTRSPTVSKDDDMTGLLAAS